MCGTCCIIRYAKLQEHNIDISRIPERARRKGIIMEIMEKTQKSTEEYEKKLKAYYDETGRLTQYPSKRPMRILALTKIAEQFEASRKYTEKEVNEIIRANIAFGDVELVRREMFQYRLVDRLKDGSAYWREENQADIKGN